MNGLALIVYFHFEKIGITQCNSNFTADKWFSLSDWISLEQWLATNISTYNQSRASSNSATATNGRLWLQSGSIECTLKWLKVATSFGRRIKDVLSLPSKESCVDYVSIRVRLSSRSTLGQQIVELQQQNTELKFKLDALSTSTIPTNNTVSSIENASMEPLLSIGSPNMFDELILPTPDSVQMQPNVSKNIKIELIDSSYQTCNELKVEKEETIDKIKSSMDVDEYVPKVVGKLSEKSELEAATKYCPGNSEQPQCQEEYTPLTTPPMKTTDQQQKVYNPNSSSGDAAEHDQYIPPGNAMDSAAPAYTPSRKKRDYALVSSGDDDKYEPTMTMVKKSKKKRQCIGERNSKKQPTEKPTKGLFGDSDDEQKQTIALCSTSSSSVSGTSLSTKQRVLLDRKAKKSAIDEQDQSTKTKLSERMHAWLRKPSVDRAKEERRKEKTTQIKKKSDQPTPPPPTVANTNNVEANLKRDREIALLQEIQKDLQPEKLPDNIQILELNHLSKKELVATFNDHKDYLSNLFLDFRTVFYFY